MSPEGSATWDDLLHCICPLLAQSEHITIVLSHVRFTPKSGHGPSTRQCPLLTQSGHERFRVAMCKLTPEPHFASHKSLL